jgi:hypothetical protein
VWQYAAPRRAALIQIYPSLNIPADPKGQSKHEKRVFSFLDTLWVTGIYVGSICVSGFAIASHIPISRVNAKTEIHTKRGIYCPHLSFPFCRYFHMCGSMLLRPVIFVGGAAQIEVYPSLNISADPKG